MQAVAGSYKAKKMKLKRWFTCCWQWMATESVRERRFRDQTNSERARSTSMQRAGRNHDGWLTSVNRERSRGEPLLRRGGRESSKGWRNSCAAVAVIRERVEGCAPAAAVRWP
ncbi:hypothetical protein DEO72_LG8g709 [Vigna unguiculata]|uniref:Uncharacterized protein n=1 Tax=Vigna unguiculata TaxID=3917 RepID=A0A4D6MPI7_VIGUN|nr:hypothetical protein DEO72_LG8g709 [Vigna unguiculata]